MAGCLSRLIAELDWGITMNKLSYCEMGIVPIHFGFCTNEAAFHKEMKRLDINNNSLVSDGYAATTHSLHNHKTGENVILVCISKDAIKSHNFVEVVGLIVHECTHAWQYVQAAMNEQCPSSEFEAYTMQALVQFCVGKAFDKAK